MLAALSLSILLILFGTGPGTSSARVNLGPLQPIEAIRLLLALFLAGYFARRWEVLRRFEAGPFAACDCRPGSISRAATTSCRFWSASGPRWCSSSFRKISARRCSSVVSFWPCTRRPGSHRHGRAA